MKKVHFHTLGPLPVHSSVYVRREADKEAREALQLTEMEYISIIAPRQQGKTSLIWRLDDQFSSLGYTFAYRDLMAAHSNADSMKEWYTSLGNQLLRQMDFISPNHYPPVPVNSASWEAFLDEIAQQAVSAGQYVVIALDEIGAMPPAWATDFFAIIRSIYTSRQSRPYWKHLTFIIAGAFNPKDLIHYETISGFNIDRRVLLEDFTLSQTKQLVSHLALPLQIQEAVAMRIHYWTDGQPYLTQLLCHYLSQHEQLTEATTVTGEVDAAVERFFREDTHHLNCIKNLYMQSDLLEYTQSIRRGEQVRFGGALNSEHFYLAHIAGVIKPNAQGMCQIRNRIYERALTEVKEPPLPTWEQIFISYSHKDEKWLDKLRTMCSPLEKRGLIKMWSDKSIEAGAQWREEINKALASSKVAILLVTPDFLASDFIAKNELPPLLEAAKKKGLIILWIAVSKSLYQATEIAAYESANNPSRPLDSLNKAQLGEVLVQICNKIKQAAMLHGNRTAKENPEF